MGKVVSKKKSSVRDVNGRRSGNGSRGSSATTRGPGERPSRSTARAASRPIARTSPRKSEKPAAKAASLPVKRQARPVSKPLPAIVKPGKTVRAKPDQKTSAKLTAMKPVAVDRTAVKAATRPLAPPAKTVIPLNKKDARPSRLQPVDAPAPLVPPPVQVSSSGDSRPKKNQAGFSAKELEQLRDLLLEKRRELVGDMNSMEREALQASESNLSTLPIHMADMGTDNYEQEFTLGLVEKDRTLLREINHALAKIQNGTYGLCEGTGKPIPKVRLEYQPWARHSIEYARMKEKHQLIR